MPAVEPVTMATCPKRALDSGSIANGVRFRDALMW